MKRLGAVIVFNPDVDEDEAAALLEKIVDDLDVPSEAIRYHSPPWATKHPFEAVDLVNEFDDDMGGPVWYIP